MNEGNSAQNLHQAYRGRKGIVLACINLLSITALTDQLVLLVALIQFHLTLLQSGLQASAYVLLLYKLIKKEKTEKDSRLYFT